MRPVLDTTRGTNVCHASSLLMDAFAVPAATLQCERAGRCSRSERDIVMSVDQLTPPPKSVKRGRVTIEIKDPRAVQPVSADLIIEARQMGGNIAISFATIVVDGNGPVDATVCARLRLSFALANELRNVLDGVLTEAKSQLRHAIGDDILGEAKLPKGKTSRELQ
jgi:hypothetical protein